MQTKTKQRLVGFFILLAILAIFLPLVFHNARPTTDVQSIVRIPPKPQVDIARKMQEREQAVLELPAPKPTMHAEPKAAVPAKATPLAIPAPEVKPAAKPEAKVTTPVKVKAVAKTKKAVSSVPVKPNAKLKPKVKVAVSVAPHKPAAAETSDSIAEEKHLRHLQKYKAQANAEQKGLSAFLEAPKAWSVQLGTFGNIENANALIAKLRKKGFDAYTRAILDPSGKRLLRVYVGPEIQKESALQLRDKLQATVHLKGVVRKYKVKT